MASTIQVNLIREAKKNGGDRYESSDGFVIYIPQNISREDGKVKKTITVSFS